MTNYGVGDGGGLISIESATNYGVGDGEELISIESAT